MWMALALILLFLIIPLITLIHEAGHALAGLAVGARHVTIQLGGQTEPVWSRNWGRVRLSLMSWAPLWVGFAKMDDVPSMTPRQRALVSLAGPVTSLILVILLSITAFLTRQDSSGLVRALVQQADLVAFLQLLTTAIPIRYPRWMGAYAGHSSDMRRAIQVLREDKL